jgi:cytochrome c553
VPRYCALALATDCTVNILIKVILGTLALSAPAASAVLAQTPNAGSAPSPPASDSFPTWAYPWVPDFKVTPADDVPHPLPGSTAAFSWTQARDLFFSPDWHPEDHPVMPEVVAMGRKPDVRACGSCHRAEGTGGPENSSLAGLPADYFVQQIADIKSGARKFSGPPRSSVLLMTAAARAMTDTEAQTAAAYFSALKPKRIVKVVESDEVPKTYIARLFFVKQDAGGTEPLGRRIVEMPDDVQQFELRDTRSQFTAYVPVGSTARGEVLAKTGGSGVTVPCATCHGPDMKGLGSIPGIAGRSPSYIVRQLYDFQQGSRAGSAGALMKPTVEKLTQEDMISVAAYIASLEP